MGLPLPSLFWMAPSVVRNVVSLAAREERIPLPFQYPTLALKPLLTCDMTLASSPLLTIRSLLLRSSFPVHAPAEPAMVSALVTRTVRFPLAIEGLSVTTPPLLIFTPLSMRATTVVPVLAPKLTLPDVDRSVAV